MVLELILSLLKVPGSNLGVCNILRKHITIYLEMQSLFGYLYKRILRQFRVYEISRFLASHIFESNLFQLQRRIFENFRNFWQRAQI